MLEKQKEWMVHIWGGAWNEDANPSIEKDYGIQKGYYYFSTEEEKNRFCKILKKPIYSRQGLVQDVKYGIMARYKIGITEAGDAGLDLSWEEKLSNVDGAVLITKNITPEFINAVIRNKNKVIVHATITGYGGTVIEPNAPCPNEMFARLSDLVKQGFPKFKIVIRVDPIFPTPKGIKKAYTIIRKGIDDGYFRFKVSIIDMYPHVRARFAEKGFPLPYGEKGFSPNNSQSKEVDKMLRTFIEYGNQIRHHIQFEACAEPQLKNALHQGCISSQDLELLGLETDLDNDNVGFQRKNCLCYSGKTELLTNKKRCPHQCLYCYWK